MQFIPNASLTDFMINTYLISNFDIKKIILPAFFDTFKLNIRSEIISFDAKNQYDFKNSIKSIPNKNTKENENIVSTQDLSEEFLNNLFEK